MTKYTLVLLNVVFAFMLHGTDGFAQDGRASGAEPPPEPLLNSPPDFSQWVVTYSYEDERARKQQSPGAPGGLPPMADHLKTRPHTITAIKTNKLVHEIIAVIEGPRQDKWYVGNIQYWKIGNEPNWFINQPGPSGTLTEGYTLLPPIGFRDLAWVSDTTYADVENYAGRQCLVFKSSGEGHDNQARIAYIDLKTRWPVEVRIGGEIRTYQFIAPPTEMLTLPDDLKQQIAIGEKVHARLDLRPQTAP